MNPFGETVERPVTPAGEELFAGERGSFVAAIQLRAVAAGALFGICRLAAGCFPLRVEAFPFRTGDLRGNRDGDRQDRGKES